MVLEIPFGLFLKGVGILNFNGMFLRKIVVGKLKGGVGQHPQEFKICVPVVNRRRMQH